MEFEELNQKYKESCRKETKRDLIKMINNFIENDSINNAYKDKVISMIVGLLTLK